MSIPQDQIEELLQVYPDAKQADEAGVTYILLPQMETPAGCIPTHLDALLCTTPRDGYNSRLFFEQMVQGGPARNWQVQGTVRILDRNWYAISWQTNPNLRIVQMVRVHLEALRG
jgi:hypothetical protein